MGESLRFEGDTNDVRVLRIDTGRGTHSTQGPVLQPMLRSLLEQAHYRFQTRPEPYNGVFLIDPRSGDLNALEAAVV